MTEIERKALALLNEVQIEMHGNPGWYEGCNRTNATPVEAVCRAIEQHEAYKREVSDAVGYAIPLIETWVGNSDEAGRKAADRLRRFIIAKPDPLVEALNDMKDGRAGPTTESYAACLRAAIEKRGGKIVWGENQ